MGAGEENIVKRREKNYVPDPNRGSRVPKKRPPGLRKIEQQSTNNQGQKKKNQR